MLNSSVAMMITGKSGSLKSTLPKRALACLLLLPLIYAATFGSAHSHASFALNVNSEFSAESAAQVSSVAMPFRAPAPGSECLICVFHKQLFNTTVPQALFIAKPEVRIAFVSTSSIFFYSSRAASAPVARLSGRAPPAA